MELVDPSGKKLETKKPKEQEIDEKFQFVEDFDYLLKNTVESVLNKLSLENPDMKLEENPQIQMEIFQNISQLFFQKLMAFLYEDSPIESLTEIFDSEFQKKVKNAFTIDKRVDAPDDLTKKEQ